MIKQRTEKLCCLLPQNKHDVQKLVCEHMQALFRIIRARDLEGFCKLRSIKIKLLPHDTAHEPITTVSPYPSLCSSQCNIHVFFAGQKDCS